MVQVRLQAPLGYGAVTPLDRQRHAGLALRPDHSAAWCAELNSVLLNAVEMPVAGLDYPLAFVREAHSGEYWPAALLGLRARQNLYVDEQGRWRAGVYVPAIVRRHPFCVATATAEDGEPKQLICVQEDQLAPSDQPWFDARGEPTAAWAPWQKLIEAFESARAQTRAFVKRLDAFGLLVPFEALALPENRPPLRLQGLWRVDEQKLHALEEAALRESMRRGELRAVYAHLLSLENFAKLLDRSAAADGRRDQAH
ncbi:MAG: SapC family protein [Sinobacteraceae bacterium]|nr:SapC family protein [Nevskia sp.]MDI3258504.1 SapC family protein [Nevskiaceae bacterium]